MSSRSILLAVTISLALAHTAIANPIPAIHQSASGKGVNYVTGFGMDALNCQAANKEQIAKDMQQLSALGVKWVRIETSPSAITGLPNPPTCPLPAHEFDNLQNLLEGVASIGATPVLNIVNWHYTPAMKAGYEAWLHRLLAAAPNVHVFEIGNEENLSYQNETYPGANPDEEPYGWNFNPADFSASDGIGVCPTDATKLSDLTAGVNSYVAWLSDTSAVIKSANTGNAVMMGAITSWQLQCWLQMLGQNKAYNYVDSFSYHAYPRYTNTPQDGAATLDDFLTDTANWPKHPVWITEYGFSTHVGDNNSVCTSNTATSGQSTTTWTCSEADKAANITTEYSLLRQKLTTPIILYTARDYPLSSAQWISQCAGNTCPGTNHVNNMGGEGLFEWKDGMLTVEPAANAFKVLGW